ncbi:hypothetical protein B5V88_04720 [Heyndrickxia sporothermodurans]|nr:hypothetical protein B5V90_20960 [Heyndrickxia sporothermodurans]PTY81293.1 hypothetical protein B5V88_04720 [Heyndrickxia sporothermodurans]PTY84236.1 hypothetical protein B5V91_14235 [Heyndrickxia sporothermodurans]
MLYPAELLGQIIMYSRLQKIIAFIEDIFNYIWVVLFCQQFFRFFILNCSLTFRLQFKIPIM